MNYNDGKWHLWTGGSCPVHPKSVVKYLWDGCDGEVLDEAQAHEISWDGFKNYKLIAFCVVKGYKQPRTIWVNEWSDGLGDKVYKSEGEAILGATNFNGTVCGKQIKFVEQIE